MIGRKTLGKCEDITTQGRLYWLMVAHTVGKVRYATVNMHLPTRWISQNEGVEAVAAAKEDVLPQTRHRHRRRHKLRVADSGGHPGELGMLRCRPPSRLPWRGAA